MDFKQNYFEIFRLELAFKLDLQQLSSRYQSIQLSVHPDKFANATPQEKRLSVQWSTQVNRAYDTLKEPLSRAIYLLQLKHISIEDNPVLDTAFLMEQIELREELEDIEAGSTSALSKLLVFKQKVSEVITALNDGFDRQFQEDINAAEQTVYKLQFINKLYQSADQLEEKLLDY